LESKLLMLSLLLV